MPRINCRSAKMSLHQGTNGSWQHTYCLLKACGVRSLDVKGSEVMCKKGLK